MYTTKVLMRANSCLQHFGSSLKGLLTVMVIAGICIGEGVYGYECDFAAGEWKADDWLMVKSPRWGHRGDWVQRDGWIENAVPTDATEKELLGKRAGETFTSMVLRERYEGEVQVRVGMAFEDRMAPLVVIAEELGKDEAGYAEYREHFEVVLFDQGVNVWHHYYADGKAWWKKAAYWRFEVAAGERHEMTVAIKRGKRGKALVVKVGEREMGYMDDSLPDAFYVGVTGCEGVNRFYDFAAAGKKVGASEDEGEE